MLSHILLARFSGNLFVSGHFHALIYEKGLKEGTFIGILPFN